MPLVNLKNILEKAKKGKYAIGAFNIYNIEDITAVILAAEEVNAPVILQASGSALRHSTIEDIAGVITRRARQSIVPICLHLDHSTDYSTIIKAIKEGFSSVMFDGSLLSYEENMVKTKEIVKIAHALDVTVEAEVGRVGRLDDEESNFEEGSSNPKEVKEFVSATNIDACAVAIGTMHGMREQKTKIDFQLLKKIREIVDISLVLHGSSGVMEEELTKLGPSGIQKVNVGTRLKKVFTDTLRNQLNEDTILFDHVKLLEFAIEAVKKEVIHKITVFGSANKAIDILQ